MFAISNSRFHAPLGLLALCLRPLKCWDCRVHLQSRAKRAWVWTAFQIWACSELLSQASPAPPPTHTHIYLKDSFACVLTSLCHQNSNLPSVHCSHRIPWVFQHIFCQQKKNPSYFKGNKRLCFSEPNVSRWPWPRNTDSVCPHDRKAVTQTFYSHRTKGSRKSSLRQIH